MARTIGTVPLARKSKRTIGPVGLEQNIPGQVGGVGFQGTGITGRRRPRRSYLLAGLVIVVGAHTLKMFSGSLHPLRVRATKEGIAFKDWLHSNLGVAKEDFQDIVAEASHVYEKENEKKVIYFNKEQELMEKLDSYIEKLEKELEKRKRPAVSKRTMK